MEHEHDSPKVNVFCAISNSCIFGLFFFMENWINGFIYQGMLMKWLKRIPASFCTKVVLFYMGLKTYLYMMQWHKNVPVPEQ
ncbi:hypothetical protein X975_05735, partial [Stegodyphus mimosarum]